MKTNMRLIALLCFLTAFLCNTLQAQEKTFNDILKVNLKNMGVIKKGEEVSGYYLFYQVDKVDRKNRSYLLQILDENLETVAEKKMIESKWFTLADAGFNDKLLMLKFYDIKERVYSFKSFDLAGERARTITREVDRKEYTPPLYIKGAEDGTAHTGSFFAVPGKGFVQYAGVKNKKWGYIIDFFGADAKKSWKYKSKKDAAQVVTANYISADENVLLSNVSYFKNAYGKNAHDYVLALDVDTGKKIFEIDFGTEIPIQIVNGFVDKANNEIIVFGMFYKKGDNVVKDKSRGIFAYSFDFEGKIKTKKLLSWEKDVSKHVEMNKTGKVVGGKYLEFHDIVRTEDGKILAIAEQYGRQLSELGVASALLGGNAPITKLVIEDMMVFKLDQNLDLESVDVFPKSNTNVFLDADYFNVKTMARIASIYGYFDYAFTQKHDENDAITFGYVDFEKRKKEKNGLAFGSITYTGDEYTEDNIRMPRKVDHIRILPAIPGYIAVFEVHRKEKRLDLRLEKYNF